MGSHIWGEGGGGGEGGKEVNAVAAEMFHTSELSLKNNIKIYINTAATCFGVTVTPSSGNALTRAC